MTAIRRLTNGPQHHFFGYYGICPWNSTGRHHLALETNFHDRAPEPADVARVILIDSRDGSIRPVAETQAFNLQQGSMLHWIHVGHGEELTFNAWADDKVVSRALNPETGETRTLERSIAAVSPAEPFALGLNFARMHYCRPVVGYANNHFDPESFTPVPDDDGLYRISLQTGSATLLVSMAEAEDLVSFRDSSTALRWFNHPIFNTDGTRIAFLYRARTTNGFATALLTVNSDGRDLRCLIPYGQRVSHFAWFDPEHLMISTSVLGNMQFVKLLDRDGTMEPFGKDLFPEDGHNAFSPDFRRIVCDTYPARDPERRAHLLLYDMEREAIIELGSFQHPEHIQGDWRCDLHPRWSRDGRHISFDSVHEGSRQIYIADVSALSHS